MKPGWTRLAPTACALLPPLALCGMYLRFSLDFPLLDQWEFPLLLQKYHAGTMSPGDLWAQHNEHRILLPRLIMLGLAELTQWDVRAELALNFLLGISLYTAVLCLIRQHLRPDSAEERATSWLPVLLSLLLFSVSQYQNWFLGWQLQLLLSLVCAVIAMGGICASNTAAALALAAAAAATVSFGNGLLLWPVGMLLLVWNRPDAWRARLIAWSIAGIILWPLYFYGYTAPAHHGSPWTAIQHPLRTAGYVFAYLGAPLFPYAPWGAIPLGLAGALTAATLVGRRRELAPWGGLALYAVGSAALTALSRADEPLQQALSPRYISIANLLWVAIAVLARRRFSGGPALRALSIGAAALLLAASIHGAYRWTERHTAYGALRPALIHGADAAPLLPLYPEPERLLERREIVRELGYSVFRREHGANGES